MCLQMCSFLNNLFTIQCLVNIGLITRNFIPNYLFLISKLTQLNKLNEKNLGKPQLACYTQWRIQDFLDCEGGALTHYFAKFSENCMKIKEFLPKDVVAASLESPGPGTDISNYVLVELSPNLHGLMDRAIDTGFRFNLQKYFSHREYLCSNGSNFKCQFFGKSKPIINGRPG